MTPSVPDELTPHAVELGLTAALPAEFEFVKPEFGRDERTRPRGTYLIDLG